MRRLACGAVTLVAVTLILFGALSESWYTAEGLVKIHVGLQEVEICSQAGERCQAFSLQKIMKSNVGGLFRATAGATYYAAILVAILLVAGVVLREVTGEEALARLAGAASLMLVMPATLTLFTFPGRDSVIASFSLGKSFFFVLGGGLVGGVAGLSSFSELFSRRFQRYSPPVSTGPGASRTRGDGAPGTVRRPATGGLPSGQPQPDRDETARAQPDRAQPDRVQPDRAQPDRRQLNPSELEPPVRSSEAVSDAMRAEQTRARAGGAGLGRRARRRAGGGAGSVQPAAADASRGALRFVVRECELTDDGMVLQLERGGECAVSWAALAQVVVRRLPVDPPFNGMIFVDLIPGPQCQTRRSPVRLLPSSQVNYGFFGGGAGTTSMDNFRRLAAFVEMKRPGILEAESRPFFLEGQAPPRLVATRHLDEYEARFDQGPDHE
jgi:hypothetical protein